MLYIVITICRYYKSEYFNVSNGVKQGGVISPIFFSLYIDPLLLALKKSQIECHKNNVYMGALSYTDDITIICPSIRGLNKMLKICNEFAQSNKQNLIVKICIKYGDKHMVDCGIKKGMFIGYVNKLRSNYDTLQPHILINLFNSYCFFTVLCYGNIILKVLIKYVKAGILP